jgi:cyclic pyranopterin phosphate synthase
MPEDMRFRPAKELLQDDEILRLARLFAELGVNKIRLTGGEPTLRENIVDLARNLTAIPGIRQLALTTNGVLLDYLAKPLREAGVSRVNVSMDSLNAEKFRRMTRWGNLRDVTEGIEAAERAGMEVKINAVVVRGFNDAEDAVDLARMTFESDRQMRFIEIMPFGGISEFQQSHIVPEAELRATIERSLGPMDLQNQGLLDGEARIYRLRNAKGTLGFISSVTNPFCAGCNRVRLTADGRIRLCLLRDGMWKKPWGHGLGKAEFATDRAMSEIGG